MPQDAVFKLCIFGDGGVGKTTLVSRYLTGLFDGGTSMTIGVDFHIKKLNIESKQVALQIWDFAGEDRFRFLLPSYVRGANGGIFMYDITRYSSLKHIIDWLDVFKEGAKKEEQEIPLLMVGGKLDLDYKRAIDRDQAIEAARENEFYGFVECSAKSGQNVEATFETITRIMLELHGIL